MPLEIEGTTYYTAQEVADAVNVTRQTFWRWRKQGEVPAGKRYRDKELLYERKEVEQAYYYANRIEPEDRGDVDFNQLSLFE